MREKGFILVLALASDLGIGDNVTADGKRESQEKEGPGQISTGYITHKCSLVTDFYQAIPIKGSTISQSRTTSWGPRVQAHDKMWEAFFHVNYSTTPLAPISTQLA